jgi:hypothetical protein
MNRGIREYRRFFWRPLETDDSVVGQRLWVLTMGEFRETIRPATWAGNGGIGRDANFWRPWRASSVGCPKRMRQAKLRNG